MARYRCEQFADLAKQMRFTPAVKRKAQLDRAELLYWQTEAMAQYPVEYVIYRITGYRADEAVVTGLLAGEDVRHDLMELVEDVSQTLEERAEEYDPPAVDMAGLCEKLRVTARTVARYRKRGLFARKLVFGDGRKVLGYTPGAIERFRGVKPESRNVRRTGRLTRMDEGTRHAIITRARRIAARVHSSPFAVAQHLAGKYGRSVETIRRLLVQHDEHDPRFAIFRDRKPPLHEREQRLIARAYRNHVPIRVLCKRFGKTADAIYRAIHMHQAQQLRGMRNVFVVSTTFELPDAEQVILGAKLKVIDGRGGAAVEQATFVRFNYLKFRAHCIIESLERNRPNAGQIDQARTYLRWARQIKQQIMEAFTETTESLTRRQSAATGGRESDLPTMLRMGRRVLEEAIETFDVSKGTRFSSHVSWMIQRYFAQPHGEMHAPGRATAAQIDPAKAKEGLEEAEWRILAMHRGLGGVADRPHTLAEIAGMMGMTRRQVFRIEKRALRKLKLARIQGRG